MRQQDDSVSSFFEQSFSNRLTRVHPGTAKKYRLAIRRITEALGREAMLRDLSGPNIEMVATWLISHGRSADWVRSIRICLRAIAREAREAGYDVGVERLIEIPQYPPNTRIH